MIDAAARNQALAILHIQLSREPRKKLAAEVTEQFGVTLNRALLLIDHWGRHLSHEGEGR